MKYDPKPPKKGCSINGCGYLLIIYMAILTIIFIRIYSDRIDTIIPPKIEQHERTDSLGAN